MAPRLHLRHPDEHPGTQLGRSLCGRASVLLTVGESGSTCARCSRLYDARRDDLRGISWEEAIRAIAHVIAGRQSAVPALTPAIWQAMDCRRGELGEEDDAVMLEPRRMTLVAWIEAGMPARSLRCRCAICEAEAAGTSSSQNWEAEQQLRPHRVYDCDFGSRDAALQMLARWRQDGPATRSSAGAVVARLAEAARLEAAVQTTQRYDRDDLPTRRAQQATDLLRFLQRAFAEPSERRGLPLDECVAIVLSTVDASRLTAEDWSTRTGLSVQAIRKLIAHGRRAFTVEAAASGYIPEPRDRTGLVAAVRARRAEIGGET